MAMSIRSFELPDTDQVVELWRACELIRPWNDPLLDIQRKVIVGDSLFLVAESDTGVVGSVMGGYDGHRGWINYLAVSPDHQRQGIATKLISYLEDKLHAKGCPKINLQIRTDNIAVQEFYKKLGFSIDDVASMGKRLVPDD